ncbi:solute carrier family 2, facilitated glucose transporter member 9-like isoform X1 [Triplophysa dalaica]|uniref:solute carrier family 2, facilitated glucose transporter member 9-like isoform X1 n=1 Tax=Triplophysa dalaica TaxID=1582913 RepID=UPI0024DFC23D|nr:solute carrier family 2, facilitated glucose transporter member 9-like isoform X1 [Triplophysa dalaica]
MDVQQQINMKSVLKELVCGKALFLIVVLGFGGTFQTGFNLTVISSTSPYIQSFINSSWTYRYGEHPGEKTVTLIWSAVVSLFAVGALAGSMTVRCVTSNLGRVRWKHSNALSRREFTPKNKRNGGTHNCYISVLREILGREEWWNILLCVPTCFCAIQMIILPFLPDAPRYILIEKGKIEECRTALQFLWGPGDYKLEIEEMLAEQAVIQGENSKSLLDMLRVKHLRWQVLSLLVICGSIQFCGITAITVFSFNIFLEAGIPVDKIRHVTLGIGTSEVFSSIISSFLIESVGRRVLLWIGFGGMSVIMALITVTLYLKDSSFVIPYITVFLVFLFNIFYAGGPAAVAHPITSEIFIQSYRPAAFMLTGILCWLGVAIFGFMFPFLNAALKSLSFVLFSCVCLIAALFVFFILPETKGKTPLEISQEFKNIRVCGSSEDEVLEIKL